MNKLYGTLESEPTQQELAHRALARQAAAEGFVLLENRKNALPLTTKRIALYGMGARKTVKGGLGSGSVEERFSVSIEEGLKNAGYTITTEKWLDDYDREYTETYQAWHDMVEEKVAGLTDPMKIIPLAHSYVYRFPAGRKITETDIQESDTDTALYVLMRQAGEGNDRRLEDGDYFLTDIERENLQITAAAYTHMILIINVGGPMDLAFLDEIPGIDAVVLFIQGGEEGGNALADVLSGKTNFSGKLTDTIPLHYSDIPFGDSFSYLNGDLNDDHYREGIYVGYRYFDRFQKPVRYPFGFGLSYTQFTIEPQSTCITGADVSMTVRVTNIGACSGKEVVQLYCAPPQTTLSKEACRLVAFQKTPCLLPGDVQELTLSFSFEDTASYDEHSASWILESGQYLLSAGSSSRHLKIAAVLELPQTVTVRKCRNCCTPDIPLSELTPPAVYEMHVPDDVPRLILAPAAFHTEVTDYSDPPVHEDDRVRTLLDRLTPEQQLSLLCGGELQKTVPGAHDIPGAAGKTCTSLLDFDIPNIVMADGPAGINVVPRSRALLDGTFQAAEVPERYRWGMLAKAMEQRLAALPGPLVYRYATAWPVEMLLAQTWNTELLEAIGAAVGEEMRAFGISVWLAPGMNIHRNPLGGRTFEYYSEDPLLTGRMAAALIRGVQQKPGTAVCIKHFCCNNAEDNRNGVSANLSERALREIYLKGFEIAIKATQPLTLMSSYNQVNHIYTANSHDLLTDILRCEWGYQGLVMTDWGSTNEKAAVPEVCAPAGNDLIMPGNPYDRAQLAAALKEGRLNPADVRRAAARVLSLVLSTLPEKD